MVKYNFSSNGLDFGNFYGDTEAEAKENFAQDSGYKSWVAMISQAKEFGGNTVEIEKVY